MNTTSIATPAEEKRQMNDTIEISGLQAIMASPTRETSEALVILELRCNGHQYRAAVLPLADGLWTRGVFDEQGQPLPGQSIGDGMVSQDAAILAALQLAIEYANASPEDLAMLSPVPLQGPA